MHAENKQNCTGCGACYNICPKNAISMQYEDYGFYKPVIANEKCINCDLCEKICPLDKYKSQNIEQPEVFVFQNSDKETLYKCASGGAFAELAKYVIEQGGIVYGVVYDRNMVVCHTRTDNLRDLEKMYSSKYVQSNTKNTFKQTKEDVGNGKLVLYSGTPCQIAGLKSFLQKEYENLITIDIVCHGVPSPLVFEKYKQEFYKNQITNIDFRDKKFGWNPYCVSVNIDGKTQTDWAYKNPYIKLFLTNLSTNFSCNNCQFNNFPRIADITIGDFWGVDEYDKSLNNNKGLSIVLLNSKKGEEYFSKIRNQCYSEEVPLDIVIKHNPNIIRSSKPHLQRKSFWEDVKNGKNLKYCVKKYVKSEPLHIKLYYLLPKFAKDFIKYKILKGEKC